jgi:hypothetical protein
MSLRSMAVMRAVAEDERAKTGTDPAAEGEQKKIVDQLIALIPTEAVSGFVALIGATVALSIGWRWAVLAVVAVLTPVWVLISYRKAASEPAADSKVPWFEMAVGLLAFLAWSTNVPGGPFDDIGLRTQYGAVITLLAAIVLTTAVNFKATWRKE